MFFALLLACGMDVGIIQIEDKPQDTADMIVDTYDPEPTSEPTSEPSSQPSSEPSTEPLEGTVGLTRYTLEQLACPACMGASQEITVQFEAKFWYLLELYTRIAIRQSHLDDCAFARQYILLVYIYRRL